MNRNLSMWWVLLGSSMLASCGGHYSTSTGTFKDAAAVAGLQYRTASQSGNTNGEGEFQYIEGETVTFSVGSIEIGQAQASASMDVFDLVGMASPVTSLGIGTKARQSKPFQQAINISVFLQTLDNDADLSNGIGISGQANYFAKNVNIDFKKTVDDFRSQFKFRKYIGSLRTAGEWGGHRVIPNPGYAANSLYSGLGLSPMLFLKEKSTNSYPADESAQEVFSYDENGNLNDISFGRGTAALEIVSKTTYDVNGNQTRYQTFYDSNQLDYDEKRIYDVNGNSIQVLTSYRGVQMASTAIGYDENDSIISGRYFDGNGSSFAEFVPTYDLNGNLVLLRNYDGGKALISYTANTYDDKNQLVRVENFDSAGHSADYNTASAWDESGNNISIQVFDSAGVLKNKTLNAFDSDGNKIESRQYDGDGVLLDLSASIFDLNGYVVSSMLSNGFGVLQSKSLNTYDAYGNCIKFQIFDGDQLSVVSVAYKFADTTKWTKKINFIGVHG